MNTYSWKITGLQAEGNSGQVINACYTVTGIDGVNVAALNDFAVFDNSPSHSAFIPIDRLSEDDVIAWIQGIAGVQDFQQAAIDAQLAALAAQPTAPVAIYPLPWDK